MSLQVWLPLTKNIQNYGFCGESLITSNITFSEGGKIGNKYLSSGTITIPASVSKTFFNKSHMSFAFWLYPIGSTSSSIIMGRTAMSAGDNRMYSIFQYPTPNDLHLSWQDETSSSTFLGGTWPGFFPADTWTHCCIVYDGKKAMIYRNGELYTTANGISNRNNFEYDFPIVGSSIRKLNDIRIYDHVLSPLEVKEISKGLILHYPLNRNGWGQENLIKDTDFGGVSKKYTVISSTEGGFTYTPTETIAPNTEYIVSCRIRGNANMNLYKICTGGNEALNWINRSQLSTTEYRSFSIVFTYPSSKTLNQIYICTRYGTANTSVGDWFEIEPYSLKLEKGSMATPWCPNSSDALATIMGLNDNVEYDTSGYGNNGMRIGTFSWISDTPKYKVSTYIPTTAIITHNRCLDNTNQEWSCAAWVKPTVAGNYQNLNNFNEANQLYHGTYPLLYLNSGTNDYYNYGNLALPANQWSHIVFVFKNSDGTKLVYINGENHTNTGGPNMTSIPKGIPDTVIIGGSYEGGLCDYREYATALSAEDVKSLYQNSAYIDNQGNIYGAVYEEV